MGLPPAVPERKLQRGLLRKSQKQGGWGAVCCPFVVSPEVLVAMSTTPSNEGEVLSPPSEFDFMLGFSVCVRGLPTVSGATSAGF